MAFKEVTIGGEMHEWVKGKAVEGKLLEVAQDIGEYNSKIYKLETKDGKELRFWGASALDVLMRGIPIGTTVRVTLTDPDFKFPSGRRGKNFKVETDITA